MIYLDNAATTKVAPEVLEAMLPYLKESYANPGSPHAFGRQAAAAVDNARMQVAALIGADPDRVIFTSGGSEGNSAVFNDVANRFAGFERKHIIVSAVEHDSVEHTACLMKNFDVTVVYPEQSKNGAPAGAITAKSVAEAIRDNTVFVSVMYMNNETGIVNEIEEIAKLCLDREILFHSDCVQALGSIPIDVKKIPFDYLTVSSHKIHGPKGVGALYVADGIMTPLIHGGSAQEFGLRGGTENVPGIVGFGRACELVAAFNGSDYYDYQDLHRAFLKELIRNLTREIGGQECGSRLHILSRSDGCCKVVNLRIDGVSSEALILAMDAAGVCISAGSACSSHESRPSRILLAYGLTEDQARNSVRISFSRYTVLGEVMYAAYTMADCVKTLLSLK